MPHRNRQIGIRPIEIDRRHPDRQIAGLGESRITGIVDAASEHELRARQPQLLPARTVELHEPIDGRYLLEQQRIVRAALLDGGCAGARRPADLALDFRQVLLDAPRRRLGLLGQRLGQQLRGFAIQEPGLEATIEEQQQQYQPDERENVLFRTVLSTSFCAASPASDIARVKPCLFGPVGTGA